MKRVLLPSLLLLAAGARAQSARIVADVTNFRNDNGVCRACLYNSEAALKNEKPLQCVQANVTNGRAQVFFSNVPAGSYAIFVFHDANNNNRMDKNFLGIPKEGYGASRNSLPFASAPGFDANKFEVREGGFTTLNIRLRNL